MNKFIVFVFCVLFCSVCVGNEWVPYRPYVPVVTQPIQPTQYPSFQVPVVVPLYVPYVPVVTYNSIIVEHKQWCLFKRYEIINVPKVQYVPIRY